MLKIILFIIFLPIALPIWLIGIFFKGHVDNGPDFINDESEKEMDRYGLEPWQKDLVRKGEYDPEGFDTDDDDIEEGDYYDEDD